MTDLLIRGIAPAVVERINQRAAEQGLAREEFLRRELSRLGARAVRPADLADLADLSDRFSDLLDDDVMGAAWS